MKPENATSDLSRELPQKPLQIEPELIVLPAAFLLVWHTAGLVAAAIAAALVRFAFWRVAKEFQAEQLRAQAAAYITVRGPHVFASRFPDEPADEVEAAAQRFRDMVIASRHPYADVIVKQVYAMPFRPLLSDAGQLYQSWDEYVLSVAAFHHQKRVEWFERGCPATLKSAYAGVLGAPKNETNAI